MQPILQKPEHPPSPPPHTHTRMPSPVSNRCASLVMCNTFFAPFPDACQHYQNVETERAWAVIYFSIWRKRQIFCSPRSCLNTAVAVSSSQNTNSRDLLGHPRNTVSPTNYFAHCPFLFKHSPKYPSLFFFFFFLRLPHMLIDFIVGKLSLFLTSSFLS